MYDLVVVGGGFGGLATACQAQKAGMQVALLEAHTRLGGCAGYFDRGDYTFDAGATALMGLKPGEPIGDLIANMGLDFEWMETPSYRVYLPDRTLEIVSDSHAFINNFALSFPGNDRAKRLFWQLQEFVGATLFCVASRRPRFPVRSLSDLAHDLGTLGLTGLLAASSWTITVRTVLRLLGLEADRPFHALIAMLLQDTVQAGPEHVPFANAAACLHAYRSGMARPRGGMKALAEGLGQRFESLGGTLSKSTLVDAVEQMESGFAVTTRRRQVFDARRVAFNLPIDLAVKLLGKTLDGRLARLEQRSRAAWSAFTGYVAFEASTIADDGPLFHQVLQRYDRPIHDGNNVLVSLSPPRDPGYGPAGVRVATMSTHVRPSDWEGLDAADHRARKQDYRDRLLAAFGRALPKAREALVHSEFATPRSFHRYTRRTQGAVGGPPVRRGNSVFFTVGADALGPGLWLVGDSVFPGQGTMAVVLSGMNVVERILKEGQREARRARSRS